MNEEEIYNLIYKYALQNAYRYNGKADAKAVVGKIFAERPDLRGNKNILEMVKQIVEKVNSMTFEDQKKEISQKFPELLVERKTEQAKKALKVDSKGEIVTRFAPNPDGPLHLGNARAAILSYEYARNGKFILRFDDTDPKVKKPIKEAYEWIKEDLRWLGIKWDVEIYASDRLEIYYNYGRHLLSKGYAYVDTCKNEDFKRFRDSKGKIKEPECLHRSSPIEENLELFDSMLSGKFREGEAVVRIKTDLSSEDPSQIDWVMLRIINTEKNPHPRVGSKYIVWPTYNFASAIDDHELGITHVLRAKEHMANTEKQKWIYNYFGWELPKVLQFGRLKLEGFMMSKSKIRGIIEKGSTIDDPRLPTLAALRRRGILPETIREIILDVGIKMNDATISFDNIAAINRKKLDPIAKRLMFVHDWEEFIIELPYTITAKIPLIPSKDLYREITVNPGEKILLEKNDIRSGDIVRLLELCNVKIEGRKLIFHSKEISEARRVNARIIHWVKYDDKVKVKVLKAEGDKLEKIEGYGEKIIRELKEGEIVQFMRFGFVRIDKTDNEEVDAVFSHE